MKNSANTRRNILCKSVIVAFIFNLALLHSAMAAVVDMLIVFDNSATSWVSANGGMGAFSQAAVDKMNLALQNSNINHSFRLVHSMSVDYDHAGLSSDLNALRSGSGNLSAVHTARNTHGADLVAMLVDTGSAYGTVGIGSLLTSWSGSTNASFSVNSIRSVDISHTLTHEVGHNLGAHHSKYQAQSPGPNNYLDGEYSAGWYFNGTNNKRYHTIMAYNNDGSQTYNSAPLFSTPLLNHQGTPAGSASEGDNSRLLRETFATVAAYRTSTVTLTDISISGPTTVNENSSATYSATATWSDGSTSTVSPDWSEDSPYTTISSSGQLTVASIPGDGSVTVTAEFTNNSITRSDSINVSLRDIPKTLSQITITGPTSVDENDTAQYTATATFSDGSTSSITPSWSENSGYTTISTVGLLSAEEVPSNQAVTITAQYTYSGTTRSDTHSVTIRDLPRILTGLTISGPASIDENDSASYLATASWNDGSTSSVAATWSEDSSYASISGAGVLATTEVPAQQEITVTASYSDGQNSVSDTHDVSIIDIPRTLTGLTITGPSSVAENSTAAYTATASWSDGSTSIVHANWQEDSSHATISSSGLLSVAELSEDETVTISASYTVDGAEEVDNLEVSLTNILSLGEALDNNSLVWSTTGDAAWFAQSLVAASGSESAAQSGAINDNQQSSVTTQVSGPGTFRFTWKVSSEQDYDYLRFYIDGTEQPGAISGETAWQTRSFQIGPGVHTLTWMYSKDDYVSEGSDCGWLDKIYWSGATGSGSSFPWQLYFNVFFKQ